MALVLSAEQKSIEQIFSATETFLIPAYQRPYSWEYDQCFQLYRDLTCAYEDGKKDYFIGNIIIAKSATERSNRYVVDGQQRLITMWLFLRVANILYPELKVLKKMTVTESREEGVEDELNIKSKVFETKDGETLKKVFGYKEICEFENFYKSYCNRNSKFVESRCENRIVANFIWMYIWLSDFKSKNSLQCKEFVLYVIDQVYMLPIELSGDSVDEANNKALKIFETINNRGMNLEDADIFKAKLYDKAVANYEGEAFVKQWLEFRLAAEELNLRVDDIFRYYSHIIRGKRRITSSETNLREFFVNADYSPLISKVYSDVMTDLMKIVECLKYIEYKQTDASEISKWLQVIKAYSNQYPIYAIVTYLFIYGYDKDQNFIELLKSLVRYVYYSGSTTTVKFEIYNIIKNVSYQEAVSKYTNKQSQDVKLYYHPRLRKGFALLAYYLQGHPALPEYDYDKIITYKDIQTLSIDNKNAISTIESIGNDIILDRPKKYLDWFNKQDYYSTSNITEVNTIYAEPNIIMYIEKRSETIQRVLNNFFFE